MSLLSAFPAQWRTDVTVTGPTHRDADGLLTPAQGPWEVPDCLIAPGSSSAPDLTDPATSEATEDTATLYTDPGARISRHDVVTVPAAHPLAGTWTVDSRPQAWPLGVVATMTRR